MGRTPYNDSLGKALVLGKSAVRNQLAKAFADLSLTSSFCKRKHIENLIEFATPYAGEQVSRTRYGKREEHGLI